jgi:23S rRNA pseudouridine1911/1915/1917 synthase
MMRRAIEREYLGLVLNVPEQPEGTIEGAIGRDEHNRLKYAIRAEGRPAVTHYALRETLRGASELSFRLETGRTHQIRVHMAAFGLPIVNDPIYGRRDPRVELPGQALHAWRLRFRHPSTGEPLSFEAEPPAAYVAAREALRA